MSMNKIERDHMNGGKEMTGQKLHGGLERTEEKRQ